MFNASNSNAIVSKSKNICSSFFCIYGIYVESGILSKKIWASQVISFWKYRLEKAELLRCPKSPVSEHLWTVNMLKGPKHCLNPHGSISVIVLDRSERKSTGKSFFLEVSEILRLFVNILTPDDKYSLSAKASV